MSDVLVTCENLGKKFCRDLKKSLWYGVKDSTADLLRWSKPAGSDANTLPALRPDEFWANHDINFEVRRGECLALIGRNGAGKTTLLKMLNGLIRPDQGSIELRGTVSGLIALGAGFNPLLTGRENIQVNGSILGLSQRQISDRLDKIVDFAELRNAINSPVRTYSSGMQVRLGFSAAINLIQPDVLLLDEVLAVGDIGFTVKCLNAMRDLTNRSAAIFVSHNMQHVTNFCSHAMMLRDGTPVACSDNVPEVIDKYHGGFALSACESGNGGATIRNLCIHTDSSDVEPSPHIGAPHGCRLSMELDIETMEAAFMRIAIRTQSLVPLIDGSVKNDDSELFILPPGRRSVRIELGVADYNAGLYPIVIGVFATRDKKVLVRLESGASIRIIKQEIDAGFISRKFLARESEFLATEG